MTPGELFILLGDITLNAGRTLTGAVRQTWLHGIPVDIEADPRGRLLTRGQR